MSSFGYSKTLASLDTFETSESIFPADHGVKFWSASG